MHATDQAAQLIHLVEFDVQIVVDDLGELVRPSACAANGLYVVGHVGGAGQRVDGGHHIASLEVEEMQVPLQLRAVEGHAHVVRERAVLVDVGARVVHQLVELIEGDLVLWLLQFQAPETAGAARSNEGRRNRQMCGRR
jgi:hypothetical protein